MASVNKDSKGWRVLFVDQDGKRRQIRPGRNATKAATEQMGRHIDVLVSARASASPVARQTALWLGELGDKLISKLANAGLIEPRITQQELPKCPTLERFLVEFIAAGVTLRGNVASIATIKKWKGTMKLLLQCFDGSRLVDSFGLADGKLFRRWMELRKISKTPRSPTGKMAENSIRQRMANCKTFFSYAVREELIADNPFRNQVSSTQENENGKQRIPRDVIDNVIESAPDAQWRLLIALWRYAGLRKMEPLELTWYDVLWNEGKLRVRSPKTRHHRGKAMRYVPIRDVRQFLSEVDEVVPAGEERILSRYAPSMSNLHKPFERIIERAGYEPWPNLIKNLRMSCENEWLDNREAPAHVIAAWMGHDIEVQNSHYAIVSDGHFDQFNNRTTEKVAHSVPQYDRESRETDANSEYQPTRDGPEKRVKPIKKPAITRASDALERTRTVPEGSDVSLGKTMLSQVATDQGLAGGTLGGTLAEKRLQFLADRWFDLTETQQDELLCLVARSTKSQ